MIFAHSKRDVFLMMIVAIEVGAGLVPAMTGWHPELNLPWLAFGAGLVFLNCTNYQCVAHNIIHNSFFRFETMNRVMSALNTLALGVPQSLYRIHHLNHHRYNSDLPDLKTGEVGDRSSIYRFSKKRGQPESILAYSALSPFRTEFGFLYEGAVRIGTGWQVWLETLFLLGFFAAIALLNWRFFTFFYLPVWYLGQAAAFAENYLEHYRAIPGNRLTDSVSSYHPVYNFVWFNNGYHQEHHLKPQVHWTKIPEVKAEMLPEEKRRVAAGAHWFNWRSEAHRT